MFDRISAAEIASAPELAGIDNSQLPSMITDAYVQVAVAKSLVGDRLVEQHALFEDLRSVAAAQLALALSLGPGDLRKSAAFVAASAFQVLSLGSSDVEDDAALLRPDQVSPRISALLLFIAADAAPDAADVARDLPPLGPQPSADLLGAIWALGSGDVQFAISDSGSQGYSEAQGAAAQAARVGYARCSSVLAGLLDFLSQPGGSWEPGRFALIAQQMGHEYTLETPTGPIQAESLIAGPWHLARLLHLAEAVILESATVAVAPPEGVPRDEWSVLTARVAKRMPLLWRNHRDAIASGLLLSGISAALAFPTGAGKSTVSELKIASVVLRDRNVVCLVPTLSLIDQFASAIASTLPGVKVTAQRDLDEVLRPNPTGVAEVFVMTPESCQAALGGDIGRFGDVGLVVFDEAHLMHSESGEPSRRALDASLCLLTLCQNFPTADVLLVSAMFGNADFIAEWLEELTGRAALSLDNPWKPTRQARGALLYAPEEIARLRARIAERFASTTNLTPPIALKNEMQALPWGLFGLRSAWETTNIQDYRFVRLLEEPVPLSVGGHRRDYGSWWLNPNANQVATKLAAAGARSGLKTLVFSQQVKWSVSIARDVSAELEQITPLDSADRLLLRRTIQLLGDESALYLRVDGDNIVGSAIPHHGLLLPEERRLHERIYKRENGVSVLVATSTVAQGMNFPSEFVLIAGDKRFDAEAERRVQLEAHELLNAAGRAGRAGSHSNALVVAIPGEVVTYDGAAAMDSGWFLLQRAFAQSDQCIELRDPIGSLLDSLESQEDSEIRDYFVRRIGSIGESSTGSEIIKGSFAAFSARRRNEKAWLESRLAILEQSISAQEAEPWLRQATSVSGLPGEELARIASRLDLALAEDRDLTSWRDWFLEVLSGSPELVAQTLRVGSRAALKGTLEELGDWAGTAARLVEEVRVHLALWMGGSTLAEIQKVGIDRGLARRQDQRLEFARKFVLRVIPDLAYLFGLPALIQRQRATFGLAPALDEGHPLDQLARAVELGVDTSAKLAAMAASPAVTRMQVHSASF